METPHHTTPPHQICPKTFNLAGCRTKVALEHVFLDGLTEIADQHQITPAKLICAIRHAYVGTSLASALRAFVAQYYRAIAASKGERVDINAILHAARDSIST